MFKIQTLNAISDIIHAHLSAEQYLIAKEEPVPDGILVRSADMHSLELPDSLLAIARAGAGTNNVPIERCNKQGIVVFNTPGANANAVAELVVCGLMLGSRNIVGGIEWVKTLRGKGEEVPKLVEKGKGEVVTAPVIRSEIGGGRVQISGRMSTMEANDTALLLRAGSLAAPMEIIEERTIGPSLGAENISKGFHSTLWGLAAISAFMIMYYVVFGLISVIALSSNLLFLIALLSLLQATLTLPGIAAMALTLGMAIDSNVLINERIRDELRHGVPPQMAIAAGYEQAFRTIVDSNVTTMIVGLALLIFGSGPVRGFAVVHCLGILTSAFSAVVVSRALVNLLFGSRRKLESLPIGQVWKPDAPVISIATKLER